jgi:hypothetical protein
MGTCGTNRTSVVLPVTSHFNDRTIVDHKQKIYLQCDVLGPHSGADGYSSLL